MLKNFEAANMCMPGFMSFCTAGRKWQDQQKCKFYTKASVANRCMYYRETLGGHCDCVDAQRDIQRHL